MKINTTESVRNSYAEVSDEQIFRQLKDAGEAVRAEPKMKVYIFPDPTKEVQDPVHVGINGYIFLIPRDKDLEVPYSVYTVLQQQKLVR